ncbi:MAG TPA: hypothetical protein PKH33_18230 [bacterium]|nr:hypothetical protein [bacterium]
MAKRKRVSARRIAKVKAVKQEVLTVAENATVKESLTVQAEPGTPEESSAVEAVKKEEVPSGILCPECRFPMRVYRTKSLTGTISRERICDRCKHREPTEEKIVED